jgi:hypothetical protein
VKPLDRMGASEQAVIAERRAKGYGVDHLERFTNEQVAVLRVLLERLLPSVPASIDLVSFVDSYTGRPLGRGDRRVGLPPEAELYSAGLTALGKAGFAGWPPDEQRAFITRMRHGDVDGELGVPAKDFVDRLLDKALAGFLAHPDTWERIGFTGPAYPEGYAWIGPAEAIARHDKKRGWDTL